MATLKPGGGISLSNVSIHATLAGGDYKDVTGGDYEVAVSIHATLAGGDPANAPTQQPAVVDVSIHATLAGGDPLGGLKLGPLSLVSIHATLAGGDLCPPVITIVSRVSIHATLAGGDQRRKSGISNGE